MQATGWRKSVGRCTRHAVWKSIKSIVPPTCKGPRKIFESFLLVRFHTNKKKTEVLLGRCLLQLNTNVELRVLKTLSQSLPF